MGQHWSNFCWDDVRMSTTSDAPVLISSSDSAEAQTIGEWIHAASLHRAGRLIVVDGRRLRPNVRFERFERPPGRFTFFGPTRRLITGGTLLLTHLETMPFGAQTQLCRFLDRRMVGGQQTLRVIATTDQLIHSRVECGEIRAELFYRLNVIHISLPETTAHRQGGDDSSPGQFSNGKQA
jgi:two-component system response regulator AtoC